MCLIQFKIINFSYYSLNQEQQTGGKIFDQGYELNFRDFYSGDTTLSNKRSTLLN